MLIHTVHGLVHSDQQVIAGMGHITSQWEPPRSPKCVLVQNKDSLTSASRFLYPQTTSGPPSSKGQEA